MGELALKIRAKYPGNYDDLSDQDLESKIVAKFPGVYDDLVKASPIPQYTGGKTSEEARKEFVRQEKGNKSFSEMIPEGLNPAAATSRATSLSDFAGRVLPESLGKLPGRLALGAYEAMKGQTDPIVKGFTSEFNNPDYSIGREMISNAGRTLQGLADFTATPIGLKGIDAAKEAWLTDPAGSGLALAPTVQLAKMGKGANLIGKGLNALPDSIVTPEGLTRSALKPYIGESAARNRQTAKGIDTFLTDRKSANPKTFMEKNVAEMEEIAGRQNMLLDEKGHVRMKIDPIEQELKSFIDEARTTPGTAESAITAAEKVLSDIKNHPDYRIADNTMGTATVQTMKKNIWKYLKEKGAFSKDGNPQLNEAMWSAADGMVKIVNDVIPEMAGENARYGDIANLNKMLLRSVNRMANTNVISLSTAMQLIRGDFKGVGMAVVMKTIDHPIFKSYLAQKMAKAQGRTPKNYEVTAKLDEMKGKMEQQFNPEVLPPNIPGEHLTIPGRREATVADWDNFIRSQIKTENPEVLPGRQSSADNILKPMQNAIGLEEGGLPPSIMTRDRVRNPERVPGRQSSEMDIVRPVDRPIIDNPETLPQNKKHSWGMTSAEYLSQPRGKILANDVFYVDGVEVVQNPTPRDYSQIRSEVAKRFPNNKDAAVRFTEDVDGNRFIWKAYDAVHSQIEPFIENKIGKKVSQNPEIPSLHDHRRSVFLALKENMPVPAKVAAEYISDPVLGPIIKQRGYPKQLPPPVNMVTPEGVVITPSDMNRLIRNSVNPLGMSKSEISLSQSKINKVPVAKGDASKVAAVQAVIPSLVDSIISHAKDWDYGRHIIDGYQTKRSYSNKTDLFPFLESMPDLNPGNIINALEKFKRGERLGSTEKILVEEALKYEYERLAPYINRLPEKQKPGDTSFNPEEW